MGKSRSPVMVIRPTFGTFAAHKCCEVPSVCSPKTCHPKLLEADGYSSTSNDSARRRVQQIRTGFKVEQVTHISLSFKMQQVFLILIWVMTRAVDGDEVLPSDVTCWSLIESGASRE
jgi:hypothetical protein